MRKAGNTPADPTIEFAKLEIDGETYELAYDFGAIAEAEKLTGCNLLEGLATVLFNGTTAMQLLGLLYAALQKAHPKITLKDAAKLIRIDTMPDIRDALLRAYNASLPEAKKILADPTEGGEDPPGSSPIEKSGSNAGATG